MRRYVIYGLVGLLFVVILLDFETASDDLGSDWVPTPVQVITATPALAPPTPELLPTVADPSILQTHTVQSGETLSSLAQEFGVSTDALMAINGLKNAELLFAGQVLLIPAAPIPAALPDALNGVPLDQIVVMPENVRQHIREIYALGQSLGRNARAFSKLGDSTIETPFFLTRFDDKDNSYKLGKFAYLQAVINYYAGSFGRESAAVRRGLHTWSVMDPMWAPKPPCDSGEDMLACEIRLNQPSVLFIRLGSNDAGIPETTDKSLRAIVEYTLSQGVIPVIGTKADRAEGPGDINNGIMRQIAVDYAIPLWDYDLIAATLPGRGLVGDQVHMTSYYAYDFSAPEAMERGQSMHDLTALMTLDLIWRTVTSREDS